MMGRYLCHVLKNFFKQRPITWKSRCLSTGIQLDNEVHSEGEEIREKTSRAIQLLEDGTVGQGPGDNIDENDEWATSPYPTGSFLPGQDQALHSFRPKVDPTTTSIILFPGQGSQYVGMGKELMKYPKARDIFTAANHILQYDLSSLMMNGPRHELDKTLYAQPAVFVCSIAALERLKEEHPAAIERCMATAGFSVGEITALTFAGVFSFDAGLKLVRVRAESMQYASELAPGGMATVMINHASKLGQACVKAREWCIERGVEDPECRIANYLGPEMRVIAGHIEALKYIKSHLNEFKIPLYKSLPVSGAFHTSLMQPAVEPFAEALSKTPMSMPVINIYSNVTGRRYYDEKDMRRNLPKQIVRAVRWEQIMQRMYKRPNDLYPQTFTCGPGSSLKLLLSKTEGKAATHCSVINA